MDALLYAASAVLGVAAAVMEFRSRRRVRAVPADEVPPVRYLTEKGTR